MYYLNLDNETNRVLSASYLFCNITMPGSVEVESLPEGNLYDYLYVDGEYAYSPVKEASENSASTASESGNTLSLEQRVEKLESSVDNLTKLVNELINK